MGKTVAVVPVRMTSSRLPGKVMAEVLGKPLLGHIIDRLECCNSLDDIVVATATDILNNPIEAYCRERGIPVFRGSEKDVLDRLLQALTWRDAQTGVLVFGDCPLIDPKIVEQLILLFESNDQLDFVSNDLCTTWPPGMEVEVFKASTLADSSQRCVDSEIREHGTLYIRKHPNIYRLHNVDAPPHLSRPDLSLEVDVSDDLTVIQAVMQAFDGRADVPLEQIIDYMDMNPELAASNRNVTRRWTQYRDD